MRDPYLAARIEDIRVVGTRLIRNLIKKPYVAYSGVPEGAIILADELTPADTALMDPRRIAGFAAQFGGADSHTAIVARALGLPAVLAVPALIAHARAAATVVIDGTEGTVIIDPSTETIGDYEARRDLLVRERRHLDPAAPAAGGDPRRRRDHPRSQSRTAGRARPGGGQRGDGAGPRALRVPLHEPRRSAGRGGAVRGVLGPGARHGRQARDRAHLRPRRRQARPLAERPLRPGRQPGARPARDPPVACRTAGCSTRSWRRCCAPPPRGRCASCCR